MKAQFALFETAMSLIILTIAGSAISLLSYEASLSVKAATFNEQNMLYDFSSILYGNISTASCLKNLTVPCTRSLLEDMNHTYDMEFLQLSSDGKAVEVGNISRCTITSTSCLPITNGNSFAEVCLNSCD